MFDNRLANLRKERGLNKKEMAKALNLPYTTYLNYENNEREPNSETLIQISNFLDVSIDYLLGVSNMKSVDANIRQAQEKDDEIIINKLEIHKDGMKSKLYLNGCEIKKVVDFSYKKTSATTKTEVTITIDIDEFYELLGLTNNPQIQK